MTGQWLPGSGSPATAMKDLGRRALDLIALVRWVSGELGESLWPFFFSRKKIHVFFDLKFVMGSSHGWKEVQLLSMHIGLCSWSKDVNVGSSFNMFFFFF